VTFTTEPLAAFNSSISPRAIMIGAKKLTWKTCVQVSRSVSTLPRREPPGPFGEIAALLTSACSVPPSSGAGEADHGGMADAAAGAGQEQRASRQIGRHHQSFSHFPPSRARPGHPRLSWFRTR
jgi:hypothetical protein